LTKRRQNVLVSVDSSSPAKRKLSLDDLLQSFILDCKAKNLSILTLKVYEDSVLRMKEAFQEQQMPLDIYTVTSRDIKNYFIAYMINQGKSDNTVNSRIKGIKQFFKYLFTEGWITQNIADELHVVKAEKLMIQTFTKEQVADLLAQPDRNTFTGFRDYTMMMILLETGMRISELCNLKIGDIFFKKSTYKISPYFNKCVIPIMVSKPMMKENVDARSLPSP